MFGEIGAIREGMESISQPIDLPDAADIRPLALKSGGLKISRVRTHNQNMTVAAM